ncbi:hypothetical protein A9P82_11430 [Arachidicoccus ginsenosidimutans]|uniref:DUF4421 family protein n=1 Tax=Arachidicoccus sp. BS20 TaxID=1850526 RepID=UPI0007F144EC|nr:DUF4421 family protein [Arachidicoccus sp. BS20]ANI89844.1 hypothetical protein A9P82_11430 [Arachidicoccus sp. BS20]
MKYGKFILVPLMFCTVCKNHLFGQASFWKRIGTSTGNTDSTFIDDYDRMITARIYYSRTNTGIEFRTPHTNSFNYKPNNSKGIGVGVSYRYVTLDFAYGVLGRDEDKGKTHTISLMSSLYKHQWVYDFGIQHYKGMYLSPQSAFSVNNNYYLRPDIATTMIGGDFWRILNSDKFSYRAVMTQNDWQLKPAGSLLLGGEIYYGAIHGDSALTPVAIADNFPQNAVYKNHSLRIGPGIGYAYTFVFDKHFFVSGGITENLDFTIGKEYTNTASKNTASFSPNLNYRISAGYNSSLWNIDASIFDNSQYLKSYYSSNYKLFSQIFRITIARRFLPGHKTKAHFLNKVDTQLNAVQEKVNNAIDMDKNKKTKNKHQRPR